MAKSNSIIDLGGTFGGITFVKSPTYGDHIRAARGTYKKAKLNEALKSSGKKLVKGNRPAKIFKDAIDPYREDLYDGSLWRRLLSMFRKQLNDDGAIDFSKLRPFEIHTDYPFEEYLSVQPEIKANKKRSVLDINISYDGQPQFERSQSIDGYRLTLIGIFPDLRKATARTVAVHSPIIGLKGKVAPLYVQLDVPPQAETYVVCIKIEGCVKGKVHDTLTSKGMRVVGAGMM